MSYSSEVLADAPIAYYRLNESSGTTMTDSSGNGRNGTYTNVTLGITGATATNDSGTAMKTSGTAARGQVTGAAWMDVAQWTYEAWTRMSPIATSAAAVIMSRVYQPSGSADPGWVIRVEHTTDGRILVYVYSGGLVSIQSSAVMFDLAWHHVVVTYNGTTVRLYVDGASVATTNTTPRRNTTSDLVIGNARSAGGDDLQHASQYCDVDEVALYDTALSSTRVAAHYAAATAAPAITGPVAATLPPLSASSAGTVSLPAVTGVTAATLPALTGSATGTVAGPVSGSADATLPPLSGAVVGTYTLPAGTGSVTTTLPPLTGSVDGTVTQPVFSGPVAATLPALTASFAIPVTTGAVPATLPALTGSVRGQNAVLPATTSSIVILGDSTGNDVGEWAHLFAGVIGDSWPARRVEYRLYNSGTGSYDAAEVLYDGGGSTVTIYNGSVGSTTSSYPYGAGGRLAAMIPVNPGTVIINYGHNHTTESPATFQGNLNTLVSNIRGLYAGAPIVISSQNQEKSPATGMADHNARQASLGAWAPTQGYDYLPVYEAFIGSVDPDSLVESDGVHPTDTGLGDGSHLWAGIASGALLPDPSVAGVAGPVHATLPALTGSANDSSDVAASVTATLPALSGSITGTAGVAPEPIDDEASPVDDEIDGDVPELALPPEGFVERPIMRRSVIVPDLSAYPKDPITGQPHVTDAEYAEWEADAIEQEVGVPHLIFPDNDDPNDVTYYRGVPVQGLRFLRREPFGDADADATIPGITSMDTHPDDTGAPHPFTRARANMEFVLRKSDGSTRRLWSGNVFTRSLGNDGRQPTMQLHALGSLYMADSTRNRPVISDDPLDYGYVIPRAFNLVNPRRYKSIAHIATGILTKERGAWSDSPMGFALDGLAKCWTLAGRQWTIAKVVGSRRQYEMRLKKTDPEWTFTNGARGVYVDLEEDDNGRNIIFGHGVNTDGGIWFNTKYPDNGGVVRLPLAADPRTQKWLFDDDGNITGTNPAFDGNVMPREDDVDFGQNSKAIGVRSAQQIVDRESVPSFVGRITVETDPREGWRGDIQAGDKLTLIGYQGRDLILHVTDVEVSLDGSMPVTLTVDERSRDAMTVAQIRDRNKEARRDPALRPGNPNRRSRLEQDQIVPFDSESKAGRVAPFFATGGAWTVVSVPFATAGRIAKVHFDTGSPMAAGLFAIRPSVGTLNSLIGNPLTQDDPLKAHMNTLENDYGLCAFWGQKGQRMGYSPGREDDSDPFTGDFDEATGFDYVAQANARLYLAVYTATNTTVSGRCYPALVV